MKAVIGKGRSWGVLQPAGMSWPPGFPAEDSCSISMVEIEADGFHAGPLLSTPSKNCRTGRGFHVAHSPAGSHCPVVGANFLDGPAALPGGLGLRPHRRDRRCQAWACHARCGPTRHPQLIQLRQAKLVGIFHQDRCSHRGISRPLSMNSWCRDSHRLHTGVEPTMALSSLPLPPLLAVGHQALQAPGSIRRSAYKPPPRSFCHTRVPT